MNERRRELLAIGIVAAVWILMVAVTDPRGEFPLNDDWSYALSVRSLVQDGVFRMTYIVPMTLVTQVLWGALFCLPFGFSFTALRISTLTAGLGGLIGTYLLLRELGAGRRISLIGAMTVAVNPVYFSLANTFMTDVPFYALSVFSIYAFVKALKRESNAGYVLGIILACLATLLRQAGLVIPVAFGAAHLLRYGIRSRSALKAAIPAVVVGAALLSYQKWLAATGRTPDFYGLQVRNAMSFFSQGSEMFVALHIVVLAACVYLGLFLFPLLLPEFVARLRSLSRVWVSAGTAALALVFYALIRPIGWMHGMPLNDRTGNILTPQGIGPLTLSDVLRMHLPDPPPLPHGFWVTITVIGVLGAAMLVIHLVMSVKMLLCGPMKSDTDRPLIAMMGAGLVLSLAPIVMLYFFAYFDRYFLPLMPFLMGAVLLVARPMKLGRVITAAAVATLILGGTISVGLTHDYLAWNRARWSALNDLTSQGVPPSDIDGGYEFNGLCSFDPQRGGDWGNPLTEKDGVGYIVTFGPYPDYDVVKTYRYRNWIRPRQGRVLVVRRGW